jgi:flagellar P-ring protein FlgI
MRRQLLKMTAILALILLAPAWGWAVRLKEIGAIQGVRDNPLIGYGLVVGLQGTGDQTNVLFTAQTVSNMLQRMGVRISPNDVKVKNVASVMVSAQLPPFVRPGQTFDALASSMGDAKSLQGGTLLLTALKGADGQTYAVAQGPVSIGGFSFGGASGGKVQLNHPTAGILSNGATVEREVQAQVEGKSRFLVVLHRDDFTTAQRAAQALNDRLGYGTARCLDSRTLEVEVPPTHSGRVADFLALAEAVEVQPDAVGKVVLDERTGTVIMGERVHIDPVAIAQGGLTVIIKETPEVSQPAPFAPPPPPGSRPFTGGATGADIAPGGQTVVVPRTDIQVEEKQDRVVVLQTGVTIGDLVRGLNAIGVGPRQLITLLQAIHRTGALHAHLEVM